MKRIAVIIVFLITAASLFAQNTKFTASAPRVVRVGEQFRLVLTLNAKGSNFQIPDFSKDFDVLAGPSTSTSSSMQIINGQVTQDFSYTYTYVLQAKSEGKFTISAASVMVDKKQYTANPLTIEVVKGNANNANQGGGNNGGGNQQQGGINDKDIYVSVSLSKTSLYQGEHLVATIKVYTKLDLAGFENMKFPSFKGFYSQDIESPQQVQLQRENVNGEIFNVGVIKQNLLFPQQTGPITIDPFILDCVVRQRVSRRGGFFDDFFGGGYQNVKVKLKSKPVKVNVIPLPAGKPADFSGAVGKFQMEANIDKDKVKTNDAITLKIKITGNGNLKLIDPLKVEFPSDFEVYDPKISENIKNGATGSSGHKSFDYLIIPRHAGTYKIPSFIFTYFDTDSKKYQTHQSKEFTINVEKGSGDESVAVVSGINKEDVKLIGSDIRYIKIGKIDLSPKGSNTFGSLGFYLAYILSLLFFIFIFIFRRKAIKERANIMLVRNKKANKVSRKRLKLASAYLKTNDKEHFYDEVLKAVWGYLSDKLSIPLSQLQRDTAIEALVKLNIDKNVLDSLVSVLDICEFARYAPLSDASKMDEVYNNASTLINTLEGKIK